jgi:hypothetical protein
VYFKNPEGRKNCVCARERRHRRRLQSQWCQTTTSLIFDAHAIIAHVRAMTELQGLMICRTFTGCALLGVNQERIQILCLLLLLLVLCQFPDPTVITIFSTPMQQKKFPEHHQSTAPLVPPILRPHYWQCSGSSVFCGQFCVIAKVAIIHRKI